MSMTICPFIGSVVMMAAALVAILIMTSGEEKGPKSTRVRKAASTSKKKAVKTKVVTKTRPKTKTKLVK